MSKKVKITIIVQLPLAASFVPDNMILERFRQQFSEGGLPPGSIVNAEMVE